MDDTARLLALDAHDTLNRVWKRRWWWWAGTSASLTELHTAMGALHEVAMDIIDEQLDSALDELTGLVETTEAAALPGQRALRLWMHRAALKRALCGVSAVDQRLQAMPRREIPPLGEQSESRGRARVARSTSARVISAG